MKWTKAPLKAQKKFKQQFGSTVKAGQEIYEIIWCYDLFSDEGSALCGLCHYEAKTIFVDIKANDIQETLVHEIFHAESYECGMKQMSAFYNDLEELCCEVASRVCKNFELKKKHGKAKR